MIDFLSIALVAAGHDHSIKHRRGVPTERPFYAIGPSIAIERNNLKPLHSGKSYPLRLNVFLMSKRCLKLLAMD